MKRHPKDKSNRLMAYWLDGEKDLYYRWGDGCGKADAWLLDKHFKGLADELQKRGYDVRTMRFTVDKKE